MRIEPGPRGEHDHRSGRQRHQPNKPCADADQQLHEIGNRRHPSFVPIDPRGGRHSPGGGGHLSHRGIAVVAHVGVDQSGHRQIGIAAGIAQPRPKQRGKLRLIDCGGARDPWIGAKHAQDSRRIAVSPGGIGIHDLHRQPAGELAIE